MIVFLTVTMILSLSVLLYCDAVMDACDRAYCSIALVEYMGCEYPGEDEPDIAARAAAEAPTDGSVLAVPGVTAWTRGNTAFASVEGYERRSGAMPYGNRRVVVSRFFLNGCCVVIVTHDEELGRRADETLRLRDGELV